MAYALRRAGRLDEAEVIYEEAIPAYRTLPDARPVDVAAYLNNLGYLRRVRGDFAGAEELYREAFEIVADQLGAGHPRSLTLAANLASALHEQGRTEETLEVLRARAEAAAGHLPEGHWQIPAAKKSMADLLLKEGRLSEAEPVYRAVAEDYAERFGPLHDQTSFAYGRIVVIRLLEGDTIPGKRLLNRLHGYMREQKVVGGGRLGRPSPCASSSSGPRPWPGADVRRERPHGHDLASKSASRDKPARPTTQAGPECRRRDLNPRHADYDSAALTN